MDKILAKLDFLKKNPLLYGGILAAIFFSLLAIETTNELRALFGVLAFIAFICGIFLEFVIMKRKTQKK